MEKITGIIIAWQGTPTGDEDSGQQSGGAEMKSIKRQELRQESEKELKASQQQAYKSERGDMVSVGSACTFVHGGRARRGDYKR